MKKSVGLSAKKRPIFFSKIAVFNHKIIASANKNSGKFLQITPSFISEN